MCNDVVQPLAERASATIAARAGRGELAVRTSDGEVVRLYWRHGTREVWVEVYDSELDLKIVIPAEPDSALDAFRDPYLYASGAPVGAAALRGPVFGRVSRSRQSRARRARSRRRRAASDRCSCATRSRGQETTSSWRPHGDRECQPLPLRAEHSRPRADLVHEASAARAELGEQVDHRSRRRGAFVSHARGDGRRRGGWASSRNPYARRACRARWPVA